MIGFNKIIVLGTIWKIKPIASMDWGQMADVVILCQQFSPKGGVIIDDYFDVTMFGELARTVHPTLTVGDIVFINGTLRKRRIAQRIYVNIMAQSIDIVAKGNMLEAEKLRKEMIDGKPTRTFMPKDKETDSLIEKIEENFHIGQDEDLNDEGH